MKQSEQTKRRILDNTIKIVARKGYAATTTREIAEKSGVSEATIFKYYKHKNQLLKKIVESTLNDFYDYSINEALPRINKERSKQVYL